MATLSLGVIKERPREDECKGNESRDDELSAGTNTVCSDENKTGIFGKNKLPALPGGTSSNYVILSCMRLGAHFSGC